jgi:hypothetical protein
MEQFKAQNPNSLMLALCVSLLSTHVPRVEKLKEWKCICHAQARGVLELTGENLNGVWAELSTLS